ncbi:unnamed protein product, partial [Closterium sp. NIES-54]
TSLVSRPQTAGYTRKLCTSTARNDRTRLSVNHAGVKFPRRRAFRGVNVRCDANENTKNHGSVLVDEESALKEELRKATRFEKRLEAQVGVPQELELFTGDELHYVETSDGWRLALWRYLPSESVPRKAHPVLLLSGIATNALGYDLSQEVSLARHLADQGFDTWVLELRGAGLSQSPFSIAGAQGLSSAKSSAIGPIEGPPITFVNGSVNGMMNSAIDTGNSVNGFPINGASTNEYANGASPNGSAVSSSSRTDGTTNGSVFTPLFSSDDEDSTAAAAASTTATAAAATAGAAISERPATAREDSSEGFSVSGSLSRTMQQLRNYFDQFTRSEPAMDRQALRPKLKSAEIRLREALDHASLQQPVALLDLQHILVQLQTCSDVELTSSGVTQLRRALDSFFSDAQQSPDVSPEAFAAMKDLADLVGPLKSDTTLPTAAASFLQQTTRLLSNSIASSNLEKRLAELQKRLGEIVESRQGVATPGVAELYEQLIGVILQTQDVASLAKEYNWDFDTYLYDDLPAAMQYVRKWSRPHDGKILAVGHSMGGILLYSRMAALGPDAGLLGVVTVASSLEYWMANSSLKLLRPLSGPARALNFPVIPVAVLARAALPLMTQPPFTLAWVAHQVSARDAMDPQLFQKLMQHNFCTIPVKLLLQMESIFTPGGLRSRSGSISYLKGLRDCYTPVLALAGDSDGVCPPLLVTETLKAIPSANVEYRLFGGLDNRRYGHYDMLVGKHAPEEVYPVITDFLSKTDAANEEPIRAEDEFPSTMSAMSVQQDAGMHAI